MPPGPEATDADAALGPQHCASVRLASTRRWSSCDRYNHSNASVKGTRSEPSDGPPPPALDGVAVAAEEEEAGVVGSGERPSPDIQPADAGEGLASAPAAA